MRQVFAGVLFGVGLVMAASASDKPVLDAMDAGAETRWRFFTDQVMGGVSTGQVRFITQPPISYARLTGQVSTANRGGFIQMRRDLTRAPSAETTGIRLKVRGDGQRYFVHLRTTGTALPWQYYQAAFDTQTVWQEVFIPLSAFVASGNLLRRIPRASSLTSVAIVAYGRDHEAQVDLQEIGFY